MKLETPELKYQSKSKSVYACEYHIIWCTKYRRRVLSPEMQSRIKEIVCEAQDQYDYIVRAIECMPDHVHLLARIPRLKRWERLLAASKVLYQKHFVRNSLHFGNASPNYGQVLNSLPPQGV